MEEALVRTASHLDPLLEKLFLLVDPIVGVLGRLLGPFLPQLRKCVVLLFPDSVYHLSEFASELQKVRFDRPYELVCIVDILIILEALTHAVPRLLLSLALLALAQLFDPEAHIPLKALQLLILKGFKLISDAFDLLVV